VNLQGQKAEPAAQAELSLVWILVVAALVAIATASSALAATRFGGRQTVGFYVPWDAQSQASLALHVDDITIFAPQWLNLSGPPGAFNLVADNAAQDILRGAKRPPKVMPLVTNAHDAQWDAKAADSVLLDPNLQANFVAALAASADDRGFAGYILDFENLSPEGTAAYPALVASLRAALAPRRKEVWVAAPLLAPPSSLQPLQAVADLTVIMAYDQCWTNSTPGPVAGVDWLAANLGSRRAALRPANVLIALGSYAYDWPEGGPAKVLSISSATALAQAHNSTIVRASPSMNTMFEYKDDGDRTHHVWMADATTVARAKATIPAGVVGWGLWRLGLEDSPVWARSSGPFTSAQTVNLQPPACEPLPR
jgi:spore germination protein YaaH